jgi:division protein CdvB (Snf7/Vps24/ESCRT-III family)
MRVAVEELQKALVTAQELEDLVAVAMVLMIQEPHLEEVQTLVAEAVELVIQEQLVVQE